MSALAWAWITAGGTLLVMLIIAAALIAIAWDIEDMQRDGWRWW